MKTVPVATFNELKPAQRLQERLQKQGILAFVRDETRVERFWLMAEPLAAIHVEVNQPDYLATQRLIAQWDVEEGILAEAVRCPECRSSRVQYPQVSRKFIMPVFSALLMALRIVPREFYCWDCQFTWPKVKRERPREDALGWPIRSKP